MHKDADFSTQRYIHSRYLCSIINQLNNFYLVHNGGSDCEETGSGSTLHNFTLINYEKSGDYATISFKQSAGKATITASSKNLTKGVILDGSWTILLGLDESSSGSSGMTVSSITVKYNSTSITIINGGTLEISSNMGTLEIEFNWGSAIGI